MAAEKVFDAEEVAKHSTEEDCWLVIGNAGNGGQKVYDVTKYLNDHPGGPEIMLEYAGKDADDMFEDIGHSSEARSKLKEYLIGSLKFDPSSKKAAKVVAASKHSEGKRGGLNPFAILALLIAIAIGYYFSQLQGKV